jgi:hypothetical protein
MPKWRRVAIGEVGGASVVARVMAESEPSVKGRMVELLVGGKDHGSGMLAKPVAEDAG